MSIRNIRDEHVGFDARALTAELKNPRRPFVSRRAVLRGAAAFITLPALESLWSPGEAKAAAAAGPPIRFITWMTPCGIWGPSWFPTDTGSSYTLSPTLASLAPVKNKVIVFAGIQNSPAVNITGSHGCGPPGMTTCVQGGKPNIKIGISVDQVYAQALGNVTRIPSLQISGTDATYADTGYPSVYNGATSWASATQPLPPLANPGTIFDQLFAGVSSKAPADSATAAALAKRKALRKSVLDEVLSEHASLVGKLGATDKMKLDEYLTSVRAAETALTDSTATTNDSAACNPPSSSRPTLKMGNTTNGNGFKIFDPPAYSAAVIDLMVLAVSCDATRVISYQQMNGGRSSYSSFPWLGITRDHHGMSHHNNDPAVGALLAKVEAWEVSLFSSFLQKLDAIKEGSSTALDNSMIFFSNELSDGNRHNQGTTNYAGFSGPTGKPILLAGTAGGKLKSGRHVKYSDAPQPNLFISMLNILGVPVTSFGMVGNTPLTGLTT